MIQRVNDAMLEMQAALLARSLYPAGHPRIQKSEKRALSMLREILGERGEMTVFAVEDRVIFENEILPSSPSLMDALFRMLQNYGVDQITLRRGLEDSEVRTFLDVLSEGKSREEQELESTPHLGLGSLREIERSVAIEPPVLVATESEANLYARQAAQALPDVWGGLSTGEGLDLLGDIVSSLSKAVVNSTGAILPLAPLKRHDEYTFVHTINVAVLSTSLAEVMGFDSKTVHDLSVSALLHDVGKQAIPRELLNKQGAFTHEEFLAMQKHTVEGARILLNTPGVSELPAIVAYEHHVRADGSGYPRVPRGWKLSLASRIVQVADVFDALRTNRPYRPGQPVPKIAEIMKHDAGTFFDPDLLGIFFQDVVARGIPLPDQDESEQPDSEVLNASS